MSMSKSALSYLTKMQVRKLKRFISLCLMTSFITACDYGMTQGNQLSEKQATPPPFHQKQDLSLEDIREVAQPVDREINITKNYSNDAVNNNITPASLSGPIGFKTTMLFEEPLSSNEERFTRLENVVQKMATRFDEIEPAIERLVQIDSDLNILTTQLEVLLSKQQDQAEMIPVRAQNADVIATEANEIIPLAGASQATRPVLDEGVNSLYGLRLSDHQDKVRLVLDSVDRFELMPSLTGDNLIIQSSLMQGINLNNVSIQNLSSVISAIEHISETGDLILSLDRSVRSTKIGRIPPSDQNPDYRTYIDLIF